MSMQKITLFTNDSDCKELGSFTISHVVMFWEANEVTFYFLFMEELLIALKLLSLQYITVEMNGLNLKIDMKQYRRCRFRINSLKPKINLTKFGDL